MLSIMIGNLVFRFLTWLHKEPDSYIDLDKWGGPPASEAGQDIH